MSKVKLAFLGGTGKLGQALALRFGKQGYPVTLGTRNSEKGHAVAAELSRELGGAEVKAADYKEASCWADVIFVVVPHDAQDVTCEQIGNAADGKIVVSTIAPLDKSAPATVSIPEAGSAAVVLQKKLGEKARVVSAFQNIAAHLLKKTELELDCDVLVCGENIEDCQTIMDMTNEIGLRGVYAGRLANSSAVEGLTAILIAINKKYKSKGAGIRITNIKSGD